MVRDGCAQRALDGCAEVRMRRSMDGRARRRREVATCRTRPIRQACRTRRPSRYARRHGRMPFTATPCSMLWAGCWRVMPFTAPSCRMLVAGWGRAARMPGHRRMSCDSTRALPLRHRHAYSRHRPTVLSSSLGQRAPAVRHAPVLMHLFVIGRTAPSVKSFSTDSRVDVGLHSIRLAEVTRASPGCKGRPVAREWGDRSGRGRRMQRPVRRAGEAGTKVSQVQRGVERRAANAATGQVRRSGAQGRRARRAVTFPSESMTFASFLIRDICFFCEHRPGLDPAQASPADPCRTRARAGVPRMCPGIRRVTA